MRRFGCLLLALIPGTLFGGVLLIDPDTVPTNAVAPYAPTREVSVALIHFIPNGKSPVRTDELPTRDGLSGVCKVLAKAGKVNVLYLGTRLAGGQGDGNFLYDSLERRPAFSLLPDGKSSFTNRVFGLALRLRVHSETTDRAQLEWDGTFSWSNDLIKLWAGDKYLTFGMSLAKVLKPGAVFTEGGDDDEPEQSGINLRSLFGKKKKENQPAEEKKEVANASFLDTDFHEIKLDGKREVDSQEVAVFSYESIPDKEAAETIYLLIQTFAAP